METDHISGVTAALEKQFGLVSDTGGYKDIKAAVEAYTMQKCGKYLQNVENELSKGIDPAEVPRHF